MPYFRIFNIFSYGEYFLNLNYWNFSGSVWINFCELVSLMTLALASCWLQNFISAMQVAILRWFLTGSRISSLPLCCLWPISYLGVFAYYSYWKVYYFIFWSRWVSDGDQNFYYFRLSGQWYAQRSASWSFVYCRYWIAHWRSPQGLFQCLNSFRRG